MATTITIFFTGLCYLSNQGAAVNVVFPNASVSRVAETREADGTQMIIPSHRVYLRYRLDQVSGGNTTPNVKFTRKDLNGQDVLYAAYLLSGELVDVKMSPDGSQPLAFASTSVTPSSPPTKKDRLPFSMVVNIRSDVTKNAGKPKPNVLNPLPADVAVVAGRLDIKLGNLAASFVNSSQVWRFKPDADNPTRDFILPQAVAWDVKTTTDEVTFAFTPIAPNMPPAHSLTLKENGKPLDIEFGNAPIDDLVTSNPRQSPDHHFEVYYSLLDARPAYLVVPHIRVLSPEGGNCPPSTGTP